MEENRREGKEKKEHSDKRTKGRKGLREEVGRLWKEMGVKAKIKEIREVNIRKEGEEWQW